MFAAPSLRSWRVAIDLRATRAGKRTELAFKSAMYGPVRLFNFLLLFLSPCKAPAQSAHKPTKSYYSQEKTQNSIAGMWAGYWPKRYANSALLMGPNWARARTTAAGRRWVRRKAMKKKHEEESFLPYPAGEPDADEAALAGAS